MFKMFISKLQPDSQWKAEKYENVTQCRQFDNGGGLVKYKSLDGITRTINEAKLIAVMPQDVVDQSRYEMLIEQEYDLMEALKRDKNNDSLIEDLMDVRQALSEWN